MHNLCFNERQNIWTTRYDWSPIVSENINDNFYSLNIDLSENNPQSYKIWHHSNDAGSLPGEYVSNWYNGGQHFEFEFVVSDPIGINKIFDDLQIISNNVKPDELEISIIGDDYEFKREIVQCASSRNIRLEVSQSNPSKVTTTSDIHNSSNSTPNIDVNYKWDWRLHQNAIIKKQTLYDIYEVGRRKGNIQYKNGIWYIQIEPIRMMINEIAAKAKEVRLRDKWAKIRIKYSGKNLAIITAIKTLINI